MAKEKKSSLLPLVVTFLTIIILTQFILPLIWDAITLVINYYVYYIIANLIGIVVPACLYLFFDQRNVKDADLQNTVKPKIERGTVTSIVVLSTIISILIILLKDSLIAFISGLDGSWKYMIEKDFNLVDFVFGLFAIGFFSAIVEEFFFRKAIWAKFKNYNTYWIIVLSMLFGLAHFSLIEMITGFLLGIFLYAVISITDDWVYCIIVHAVYNSLVLVTNNICILPTNILFLNKVAETNMDMLFLAMLSFMLFAVLAGIFFLCLRLMKIKLCRKRNYVVMSKTDKLLTILLLLVLIIMNVYKFIYVKVK